MDMNYTVIFVAPTCFSELVYAAIAKPSLWLPGRKPHQTFLPRMPAPLLIDAVEEYQTFKGRNNTRRSLWLRGRKQYQTFLPRMLCSTGKRAYVNPMDRTVARSNGGAEANPIR